IPESASSDGTILTYQLSSDQANLWEVDPRTAAERQLTLDGRSYFWPSAAASHLIASQQLKPQHRAARDQKLDTDLVVGVSDGSDFHPLTEREIDSFSPRLSPDGKWLAFLQWSGQADVNDPVLFVTALGTGVRKKVAERFASPGYTIVPPFDQLGSAIVWSQ